jgi:serine protease Do
MRLAAQHKLEQPARLGQTQGFEEGLAPGQPSALLVTTAGQTLEPKPDSDQPTRVPNSAEEVRLSYAPVVKQTARAVVNIYTTKIVSTRNRRGLMDDPFFRQFFDMPDSFGDGSGQQRQARRVQNSLGSGVIVHPEGFIITNNHVIEGGDEIYVVLADEREMQAKVLVADEESDLAILQVEPEDGEPLPYLETADSDEIQVGDLVLAIGNPFGVGQTVTSGIVSATARSNRSISDFGFFIQTDAAINPGNSGGALVDMQGRLIGVNTAIFSRSGGSNGIGFAIPANRVRAFFNNVAESGGQRLIRPWSGLQGQSMDEDLAKARGLEQASGVIISDLYDGGPGERAGVRRGDVVVAINGKRIRDTEELRFRLSELVVGETAELSIMRGRPAQQVTLTMDLEEAPNTPKPNPVTVSAANSPLHGAILVGITPALSQELRLPNLWSGVMIESLSRYSLAARIGFRPGDVIVGINGATVATTREAVEALREGDGEWTIRFYRNGRLRSVRLSL